MPSSTNQMALSIDDRRGVGPSVFIPQHLPELDDHSFKLKADVFEVLPGPTSAVTGEDMADGCGFIPEPLLLRLLGDMKLSKISPLAIQVRIFSPRLGVCKGMLMSKPGIDRIQVTRSMVKVMPFTVAESSSSASNWVWLL